MAGKSLYEAKPSAFGDKLRKSLAVGGGINDDNLLGKPDPELRICFGIALDESDVIAAREPAIRK